MKTKKLLLMILSWLEMDLQRCFFTSFLRKRKKTLLALCSFAIAKHERPFLKKIKVEFADLTGRKIGDAESYELFKLNLLNIINAGDETAFKLCRRIDLIFA